MNPLTNVKNITKLGEQDLRGNHKTSWHDEYKSSAWIFFGGCPYDLTEGDIVTVFSQYGEIVNINLVRDKDTGKQKGYGFLCYEDQRSTTLAVDNLNGIKLLGRIIRVDHVADYKAPKDSKKIDDVTRQLRLEGCAPARNPIYSYTPASSSQPTREAEFNLNPDDPDSSPVPAQENVPKNIDVPEIQMSNAEDLLNEFYVSLMDIVDLDF